MKKIYTIISFLLISIGLLAQPANDNCASATTLTNGAACIGGTTLNATVQVGETFCDFAGSTEETVWYRFTAANDSMVLGFIQTNSTNAPPRLSLYGPNPTCLPTAANQIFSCLTALTGDPGRHLLFTGLTVGASYFVQIQGNNSGGPADRHTTFCMSIQQPAANGLPAGSNVMDACGTAFSGTTAGGTWNSGTGSAFSNLDNNAATTCLGCAAGLDVPYVTNNTAWFTFCAAVAGTWRVTLNNVSACRLAAPNSGVQATVFTGTSSALVFNQTTDAAAPYQVAVGQTWTSTTFTVAAGSCAFVSVDGFAGDECNYSLTLTNMSGGCVLLATKISKFEAKQLLETIKLNWEIAQQENTTSYFIERSSDAINFTTIGEIAAAANSSDDISAYSFIDNAPQNGHNYYRLRQVFFDGTDALSKLVVVEYEDLKQPGINVFPNPAFFDLTVDWQHVGNEPILVNIKDFSGKDVFNEQVAATEGVNNLKISTNSLPKGMYILRIQNDTNFKQTTFLKQ